MPLTVAIIPSHSNKNWRELGFQPAGHGLALAEAMARVTASGGQGVFAVKLADGEALLRFSHDRGSAFPANKVAIFDFPVMFPSCFPSCS
jgi:hypothetical protein